MPTNFCRTVSSHICFWVQALIADSGAKHYPHWKTTAVHPLVLKGSKFHQWERKFHQIETSCCMSMTLSVGFCLRSDCLLWAQTTQNAFRRHQYSVKCPLKDNCHPLKSRMLLHKCILRVPLMQPYQRGYGSSQIVNVCLRYSPTQCKIFIFWGHSSANTSTIIIHTFSE